MPRGRIAGDRVTVFEERPEVMRADLVLNKRGGSRMQAPQVD